MKNRSKWVLICGVLLVQTANAWTPQEFEQIKAKADQGEAVSLCRMGCCYQDGDCVIPDAAKSRELIRRAADLGSPRAIAICYENGYGVAINFARAYLSYRQAADAGDVKSMMDVIRFYQMARGGVLLIDSVAADSTNEVAYLQRASDCGDAEALRDLASHYKYGLHAMNLKQDKGRAAELMRRRAEVLRRRSDLGDVSAMWALANCYRFGDGVEINKLKMAELYLKAAVGGNVWGMRSIADEYYEGKVIERNLEKAEYWYGKAKEGLESGADHGDVRSMKGLVILYAGFCGRTNLVLAAKCANRYFEGQWKFAEVRAQSGCLDAVRELVSSYHYGFGGSFRDETKSTEWKLRGLKRVRELAESGNVIAAKELASAYRYGRDWLGVEKDEAMAFSWSRKAAEAGDVDSMRAVASAYRWGGGDKSESLAFEWYMKAAQLGDCKSMHDVANAYYSGRGVVKSEEDAFAWYLKAADAGHIESMKDVARFYRLGWGVAKDVNGAAHWYEKAADAGDVDSMAALSEMWEKEGEREEAAKWGRRAFVLRRAKADDGDRIAMRGLGECYEKGIGTAVDLDAALDCYQRALNAGVTFAEKDIWRCQSKKRER